MKKYFWAFKMSVSREFTYRLNLAMSIFRSTTVLLLLYFVWLRLSEATGSFAGYSAQELSTYVFLVFFIGAFTINPASDKTASEINEGLFSLYLVKPVHHFLFSYFRGLGNIAVRISYTIIELITISFILNITILTPSQLSMWVLALIAILLAHLLQFLMTYTTSLIAFWSREANGPRFLFDWFSEFASGNFFPLTIVGGFYAVLMVLPFAYTAFAPIMIYLERVDAGGAIKIIGIQIIWIAVTSFIARMMWKRGLKRYTGEGI